MDIREYLANNRLITDGAMGTWYDRLTGYKGKLAERANLDDLQQIRDIHRAYIEAGARLIRTNTFAVNSMFFSADEIEAVLKAAWENACEAVSDSGRDVWIAADMGPIDENLLRMLRMNTSIWRIVFWGWEQRFLYLKLYPSSAV